MPVTSDDLWLINAGTAESAKLDQALDYNCLNRPEAVACRIIYI